MSAAPRSWDFEGVDGSHTQVVAEQGDVLRTVETKDGWVEIRTYNIARGGQATLLLLIEMVRVPAERIAIVRYVYDANDSKGDG